MVFLLLFDADKSLTKELWSTLLFDNMSWTKLQLKYGTSAASIVEKRKLISIYNKYNVTWVLIPKHKTHCSRTVRRTLWLLRNKQAHSRRQYSSPARVCSSLSWSRTYSTYNMSTYSIFIYHNEPYFIVFVFIILNYILSKYYSHHFEVPTSKRIQLWDHH
jgi:hypothetical protein